MEIAHGTETSTQRNGLQAAAVIASVTVAVAAGGALITDPNSEWYLSLEKPPFNPPNEVFGPVWTTIYALTAISAWLAWRDSRGPVRRTILWLFAANAALNFGWSAIFFRGHSTWGAATEIVALLGTILALIWLLRPWNKTASLLLVPYAAWVSFATVLTWTIAVQN